MKAQEVFRAVMCKVFGHLNNVSCADKEFNYTHDQCGRCGVKLPIAYPYHKEYETERRRAVCHQGADGYCAKCHEGMYP